MRELNMDTQRQNFWKESINNEVTIRNRWFQQHMNVGFAEKKTEAAKPRKVIQVQPLQTKELPSKPTREPTAPALQPTNKASKSMSEMRVASAATRNILYTGLSAEGDGRKAYLLQRKIKGPEEKFEYPLTSALEVGWKIREVSSKIEGKPAQFGRSRIVHDTFYRTNGVL